MNRQKTQKEFLKIYLTEPASLKPTDPSTRGSASYRQFFDVNESRASKYTILTFLPLALFRELTRPVNIYFGVMTFLWLIPAISPFRMETVLGPYIFIISVALIREAVEDIARHTSDR